MLLTNFYVYAYEYMYGNFYMASPHLRQRLHEAYCKAKLLKAKLLNAILNYVMAILGSIRFGHQAFSKGVPP